MTSSAIEVSNALRKYLMSSSGPWTTKLKFVILNSYAEVGLFTEQPGKVDNEINIYSKDA